MLILLTACFLHHLKSLPFIICKVYLGAQEGSCLAVICPNVEVLHLRKVEFSSLFTRLFVTLQAKSLALYLAKPGHNFMLLNLYLYYLLHPWTEKPMAQ